MKMFDALQNTMERVIEPFAAKIAANKSINAIQAGMMMTMPLTIGISVVTILSNLPIEAWTQFLRNIGIYGTCQHMMMGVLNMMSLYIVMAIAYSYAKNENENAMIVSMMSTATFIALMPQSLTVGDTRVQALLSANLGSNGVFVAMLVGVIIPKLYCWLKKKNLKLSLPESVPSMVSDSLEPIFVAMIVFAFVTLVKFGFQKTPYGDIFIAINTIVGQPVMKFGTTPWAYMIVYTIANFLWFFGIHPAAVTSVYRPVTTAAMVACTEAFVAGEPLPYALFMIIGMVNICGGTGNTLGLVIQSCFAKSEKYKSIGRVAVIPNLFNINEPVIYGFPVMLNPIFFVPIVLSSLLPGIAVVFVYNLLGGITFNPTISLPWVTPTLIQGFAKGGFVLAGVILMAIVIDWLLYLPFFRIADKKAYEEEQAAMNQQ